MRSFERDIRRGLLARTTLLATLSVSAACVTTRTPVLPVGFAGSEPCHDVVDVTGTPSSATIDWRTVTDARDRHHLTTWCRTVGPAVVTAPRDRQPMASGEIVVANWNVHVGGGRLTDFIRELDAGRLTGGAPPAGFVLLLQEAVRRSSDLPAVTTSAPVPERIESGTGEDVVSVARREGLSLFYLPSMRNGRETGERAEDRGNAVLSTLPLTDLTAVELPFARQRRVAIAATVDGMTPDGEPWRLRVVTAHLDAGTGSKHVWLFSSAHREEQARHLVHALDLDEGETATVVGGDLNTWAGGTREPAFAALAREFPRRAAGSPVARWLSLDHLFFRLPRAWRTEPRAVASAFGSDHRPIVIRVRPA